MSAKVDCEVVDCALLLCVSARMPERAEGNGQNELVEVLNIDLERVIHSPYTDEILAEYLQHLCNLTNQANQANQAKQAKQANQGMCVLKVVVYIRGDCLYCLSCLCVMKQAVYIGKLIVYIDQCGCLY